MKNLLSVYLLLTSLVVFSQDANFNIKISPLTLIDDFSFPTIQGGFEIKLSERLSLYNELGAKYRKGIFEDPDTSFIYSAGFKVKSEIRYYFPKIFGVEDVRTILNGLYAGANIFYIRDTHNSHIDFFSDTLTSVVITDDFAVKKNVLGLNLVLGLQRKISRHFSVDVFIGAGYRLRIIHDLHLEYDPSSDRLDKPSGFTVKGYRNDIDVKTGLSTTPGMTFGIRLGYRI